MSNLISVLVKFALLFLALQFLTYYSFGLDLLKYEVVKNRIHQVVKEPDVLLFANNEIRDEDFYKLYDCLKGEFCVLDLYYNRIKYRGGKVCIYGFDVKALYPFCKEVEDVNIYKVIGTDDSYAEGYKGTYLWVLFYWININHDNTWQT